MQRGLLVGVEGTTSAYLKSRMKFEATTNRDHETSILDVGMFQHVTNMVAQLKTQGSSTPSNMEWITVLHHFPTSTRYAVHLLWISWLAIHWSKVRHSKSTQCWGTWSCSWACLSSLGRLKIARCFGVFLANSWFTARGEVGFWTQNKHRNMDPSPSQGNLEKTFRNNCKLQSKKLKIDEYQMWVTNHEQTQPAEKPALGHRA